MIDERALKDELKEVFAHYMHRADHPVPTGNETLDSAIQRYRTESIFHARVDSLVYGVLDIVLRHDKEHCPNCGSPAPCNNKESVKT